MTNSPLMKLFPTTSSFVIFNLYILLFVSQALLVKASQDVGNSYSYSTVCVVLLTEVLKLVASTVLYLRENSPSTLWHEVVGNKRLLTLYLVPAALYCLYNNLAFHNLAAFDPTTYYLLLQFRVVVTAVVYQVVFQRRLSGKQWLALVLLTFGCILKQLDAGSEGGIEKGHAFSFSSRQLGALMLVLVQTLCSCFAGVYNEYLLKGRGAQVPILVQNVFMYLDSILCNVLVLVGRGEAQSLGADQLFALTRPIVLLIVCNNAAVGIVTSFFLMQLDSILKVFASGLDLVLTAILCLLLFGIPIHAVTAFSIGIVLAAVWIYSRNPLVKKELLPQYQDRADKEALLVDEA